MFYSFSDKRHFVAKLASGQNELSPTVNRVSVHGLPQKGLGQAPDSVLTAIRLAICGLPAILGQGSRSNLTANHASISRSAQFPNLSTRQEKSLSSGGQENWAKLCFKPIFLLWCANDQIFGIFLPGRGLES